MATLEEVLKAEKKELDDLRKGPAGKGRLRDRTAGLAFSGGGIRSATFHLGVLQKLAEYGLLKQFDYLSTVSGGGYIGSWLARWIQQEGIEEVERKLPGIPQEAAQVDFLRDYSNFLTPRKGLFGADTWAAIATYLRNLLLNQTILIAFTGALMFLPWILSGAFILGPYDGPKPLILSIVAGVLVVLAVACGTLNTSTCSGGKPRAFAKEQWVLATVVLPLFAGAFLLNYAIWRQPGRWTLGFSVISGAAVYALGHFLGWLVARIVRRQQPSSVPLFRNVLWALPAGVFAGYEMYGLSFLVYDWKSSTTSEAGLWHAVTWGPPLVVVAFLLVGTLHTGLAKFALTFEMHEWWARLGGWLMLWALFWGALFGVAFFAPWGAEKVEYYVWTKRTLIAAWVLHSSYGAALGWSKNSSGKEQGEPGATKSSVKEVVAKAAPFVFVVGLFVLLSCGVHKLVVAGSGAGQQSGEYWGSAAQIRNGWVLEMFGILLFLSVFLSWRVDINRYSMNLVYRNRIVRCYLGASNSNRQEQPFTGFDPADDVLLKTFAQPDPSDTKGTAAAGGTAAPAVRAYDGPYPILNATLNVTHGQRLAWQERKAECFVFTPRFCGYDFPELHPENNKSSGAVYGAYQPTAEWAFPNGGIPLGSAVAVSGAAVNPNCGYHTFAPLAFLMTVFNVRLGVWLANPRFGSGEYWTRLRRPQGGPGLSLLYLLNELFATATDESKYVNLSDGAHFENLALYELVRRECDFIVAGDAGEDPGPNFADLVNAIRKCRTDLGAEIYLDLAPFTITGSDGYATAHAVPGNIKYASGKQGKLWYVKSSLTKKDPLDVLAYKRAHETFPHQSTADQWFDESQFESYRMLGRCSIQSIIAPEKDDSVRKGGLPSLFS
jgi:predicted acylesterase/phospholipase RssA